MLTAKGKYGLKAVVHLAGVEPARTTQAIDIAEAHNIPKKFLDAILGDLRTAGIVLAKKGPGGGYRLARAADPRRAVCQRRDLAEVLEALKRPSHAGR